MKFSLQLTPSIKCLSELKINETLHLYKYSRSTVFNVMLVLEEILSNIIKYSECTSDIIISMELCSEDIHIHIADDGKEFNPVDRQNPDLEVDPLIRPEGGMGIFITKQLVRSISYKRVESENILAMTLKAKKTA